MSLSVLLTGLGDVPLIQRQLTNLEIPMRSFSFITNRFGAVGDNLAWVNGWMPVVPDLSVHVLVLGNVNREFLDEASHRQRFQ